MKANMENTLDSILKAFEKMAQQKEVIDPHLYLQGCEKINALLQGAQEELFIKDQTVAKMRKLLLEESKTASYAKMVIEASDEYLEVRLLKAKIDRAIGTIQLGKKHATLSSELMRSQM